MLINLIGEKSNKRGFNIGDILIFYDDEYYDYYQVVFNNNSRKLGLLALEDSKINDDWVDLKSMINDLNEVKNGFRLIEVLNPNEVVLRRVADE